MPQSSSYKQFLKDYLLLLHIHNTNTSICFHHHDYDKYTLHWHSISESEYVTHVYINDEEPPPPAQVKKKHQTIIK